MSEPPPRRQVSLLADPGFEGLPLARPGSGWYLEPIWADRVETQSDADRPLAGDRSLAVRIAAPREEGMYYLSQQVPVRRELRGEQELELAIRLRGGGGVTAALSAYVWQESESRMQELASRPATVVAEASEARLRFRVPAEHDSAYLYVYFNGPPGSTLWLDDARTSVGPPQASIPADWCSRFLAHELPRVLLLQAGAAD